MGTEYIISYHYISVPTISNFVELMLIIDRYLAQLQLGPLSQLDTPGNSAVLINVITGVSPPHFDFVVFLFYVLIATEKL
jgi:hypothetical protein